MPILDGVADSKANSNEVKTLIELKGWNTAFSENSDVGWWKANLIALAWIKAGGTVEETWKWSPPDTSSTSSTRVNKTQGKHNGKGNGKGTQAKGKCGKRGAQAKDKGKGKSRKQNKVKGNK